MLAYAEAMTDKRPAQAAWVPFSTKSVQDRVETALTWLHFRAAARPIVVLSPDHGTEKQVSWELHDQDAQVTTKRQTSWDLPEGYAGFLAFEPREQELHLAARRTWGRLLCVVEDASQPVTAWGHDVQAMDLSTDRNAEPYPQEVAELLDELAATGTNRWTPQAFYKKKALAALKALQERGFADTNDLKVVAAGRGFDAGAIANLIKFAKTVGFTDPPMRTGL